MANKKPDRVIEKDGYTVEIRRRRSELDFDAIRDGVVVEELGYPKVGPELYDDFAAAAVMIAKRNAEKKADKHG